MSNHTTVGGENDDFVTKDRKIWQDEHQEVWPGKVSTLGIKHTFLCNNEPASDGKSKSVVWPRPKPIIKLSSTTPPNPPPFTTTNTF